MSRGKKRSHGYIRKTPPSTSPADIMRSAYQITKMTLSKTRPHRNLKRLIAIRQRWLENGKESPPPGALIVQKSGLLAQYISVKGVRGLRPLSPPSWWCVYAIVNLQNGRSYVGRTKRSPYLRFQEHVEKDTDHFGRALCVINIRILCSSS